MSDEPGRGLLLCDDLIFASRITAEARAQGLFVKTARTIEALTSMAREDFPRCIIVDLALAGPMIGEVVPSLRDGANVCIVAYGSHVDAATLKAARAAGCDVVLPRSKFVEELARALATWFNP